MLLRVSPEQEVRIVEIVLTLFLKQFPLSQDCQRVSTARILIPDHIAAPREQATSQEDEKGNILIGSLVSTTCAIAVGS